MKKWIKYGLLISILSASIVTLILAPILLHENRLSFTDLKPNVVPQFEVGEKFSYLTTNRTLSKGEFSYSEDVFVVNRTIEILGMPHYEVIMNHTYFVGSKDESTNETKIRPNSGVESLYYNAENGTCLTRFGNSSEFRNADGYAEASGFFAYWMLCVEEGLVWGIEGQDFASEMQLIIPEVRFEVVGQENI